MSTGFPLKANPDPRGFPGFSRLPFVSPWNNSPVYYREITASTMEDAEILLAHDNAHGSVLAAGFQTRGRGRFASRVWESESGRNLLFTLILHTSACTHVDTLLPLLTGLAVARTIEELFSLRVLIKWPNDVLLCKKKVAGILCVRKRDFFLIGVGINCNQREFLKNAERAISLRSVYGRQVDTSQVLKKFLERFRQTLDTTGWRAELEARLFLKGKHCTILHSVSGTAREESGVILGIGENGELVWRPDGSPVPLHLASADITLSYPAKP